MVAECQNRTNRPEELDAVDTEDLAEGCHPLDDAVFNSSDGRGGHLDVIRLVGERIPAHELYLVSDRHGLQFRN